MLANCTFVALAIVIVSRSLPLTLACFSSGGGGGGHSPSPSPGGDSPPQNQLPPVPAAVKSNYCGHNKYYSSSQNNKPGQGIVGGINAAPNEYPWLVRLKISLGDGTSDLCGSALIDDQWLITAAHCAKVAINASYITAIFGDWDKLAEDTGEFSKSVSRIVINGNYSSSTNDYDFALLKLSSPVDVTKNWTVQTLCLPENCQDGCQVGAYGYISGWGVTTESGTTASRIQQKAYIKIIDQATCVNNYKNAKTTITDRMTCAGWPNGGVDTCLGDSGGPMMSNEYGYYQLCGVTSFGVGCARVGYFGVYARVCTVVDWINYVVDNY